MEVLMANLSGKVALVTGSTDGVGRMVASRLAEAGAQVIVHGRDAGRGRDVVAEIEAGGGQADFIAADLSDLARVRALAEAVGRRTPRLDLLVNNAGIGGGGPGGKRQTNAAGQELRFAVNYLAGFVLTTELLPTLKASAPARIVNVSSEGHYRVDGIDFDAVRKTTRTRTAFHEYCVSKLANLLHAEELARRLDGTGVTTYALHPGAVASDVWRQVPWPVRSLIKRRMISTEDGALTSLYCATAPELAAESGRYYDDLKRRTPNQAATPELAGELWERSAGWVAAS
jgi:NAD(P)-dependent dehydrogenase (short-subunit alcohol dehydrogenase family)